MMNEAKVHEAKVHDNSFNDWLISKKEWVEKTAGAVVLIVEMLALLTEIYHGVPKTLLTQLLNLFFLGFIYMTLRDDFKKRFSVDPNSPEVARILRFSDSDENVPEEIQNLIDYANDLIGQLKSINGFFVLTALLYFVLALQYVLENRQLLPPEPGNWTRSLFHIVIDLLSYGGAFFLLRCFYVMYRKTIEDDGEPTLNKQTEIYIFFGIFLMTFDVVATVANPNNGIFVSEFICGLVNAIVFILFVARFESKLLEIPPWMLSILYLYAILQTCLPFVTKGLITDEMAPGLQTFLEEFSSIVLSCCLIGKVALSGVLLYVINSKRLFYYFMSLRKIYKQEEDYWGRFDRLSDKVPDIATVRCRQKEGLYVVTIAHPRKLTGSGSTYKEAMLDLIERISNSGDLQPTPTIWERLANILRRLKPSSNDRL